MYARPKSRQNFIACSTHACLRGVLEYYMLLSAKNVCKAKEQTEFHYML